MGCVIIGAGAAGIFAAISAKEHNPECKVLVLEKTRRPLAKVKISGGGRCNVTHACFEPQELVKNYPRGSKALLGPFNRFSPKDTIQWFEKRGVRLKVEPDGRMFPTTDSSQTIIDCLLGEAERLGVILMLESSVQAIERTSANFCIKIENQNDVLCSKLLLASGSVRQGLQLAASLGHTIVPCVPSLFTFNIDAFDMKELAGISVPQARVRLPKASLEQIGPLLITHWGFSGPAVLKLSAFGARFLHDCHYKTSLEIGWLGSLSKDAISYQMQDAKTRFAKKLIANACPFQLPVNLWKYLTDNQTCRWAELSKVQEAKIVETLFADRFTINGQTTYKEEFVTCGGIHLDEVNFKSMESKRVPNLFFAGEILDVDGITGGFNFQNAWTGGWIAGRSMAGIV